MNSRLSICVRLVALISAGSVQAQSIVETPSSIEPPAAARVRVAAISEIPATIGVNVSGAEYARGAPGDTYSSTSDLDYLQSQGITLLRVPVSWEKLQHTLNGPLDPTELSALQTFLSNASAHGMQVIIDLHNYGRYNPGAVGADGVSTVIKTASLDSNSSNVIGGTIPISAFADFWTQLASALHRRGGLAGYDLMNEPHDMGNPSVWPQAAQAAVDAIRSVDMDTTIYVEGDRWAHTSTWATVNANLLIKDPANKLVYEAHEYFDKDRSGSYKLSYDQEGAYPIIGVDLVRPFLQWLQANNAKGFIGEFGVPNNDPRWITVLDNFMNAIQEAGVSGTDWVYRNQAGWWPNPIVVNPINGVEQPQMAALFQHTQPIISSFLPDSGAVGDGITSTNHLTLTGTGASNSVVKVFEGATQLGVTTVNANGVWSFTTGTLSNGTHSFYATQMNAAGIISQASSDLAPTVNRGVHNGVP